MFSAWVLSMVILAYFIMVGLIRAHTHQARNNKKIEALAQDTQDNELERTSSVSLQRTSSVELVIETASRTLRVPLKLTISFIQILSGSRRFIVWKPRYD